MYNAILEQIHRVLVNLVWTCNIKQIYVNKYDPWLGIFSAAAFEVPSTTNKQKGSSPGPLLFGCGTILPIKKRLDQKLTRNQNQTQSNKYYILKNIK